MDPQFVFIVSPLKQQINQRYISLSTHLLIFSFNYLFVGREDVQFTLKQDKFDFLEAETKNQENIWPFYQLTNEWISDLLQL